MTHYFICAVPAIGKFLSLFPTTFSMEAVNYTTRLFPLHIEENKPEKTVGLPRWVQELEQFSPTTVGQENIDNGK